MDLPEIGRREGGMDWIDLAQDRGRWQDFVNAVFHKMQAIFSVAEDLLAT
jgi:hypothetical protein